MSTSASKRHEAASLKNRRVNIAEEKQAKEALSYTAGQKPHYPSDDVDGSLFKDWGKVESVIGPILFTLVGAWVRLSGIGAGDRVVWDEAHFGKFGSFYLKHQYYFDVHPPLGKMLCGLSGYIAGYNGTFGFESGTKYPEWVDYTTMREFNAMFSILSVPTAYFTAKALGFRLPTVWLVSTMVTLELSLAALARFILLDSMLILFTTTSFLGLSKFHQWQRQPFSIGWWFWLVFTGASIGLTTSVKMVGLFITTVVGIYTIADLWVRFGIRDLPFTKFVIHFAARAFALIVVPILIFIACFKVHFMLLTKTGDGVATMSSLFKANLEGENKDMGPLDLAYGSRVTIKNGGLGGGLLHSHIQTFPEGSKQQQVTTYGHMDSNNEWIVDYPRWEEPYTMDRDIQTVQDGDVIRLVHYNMGRNLHSHEIRAPLSKGAWEVSGYGNDTIGDEKDNWVVEIAETLGKDDPKSLHPLTTSFRLRHQQLGCYLSADGKQLPEWGFRQNEVACVPNVARRNKNTWWNIEQHWNARLPDAPDRELPKSKFLRDFVQLNVAQMASNNALVPDQDKNDDLASSWWQWPIVHRGLRMCGWGNDNYRYYLLGTPSTIWLTTLAAILFVVLTGVYILRWQRGIHDFTLDSLEHYLVAGGLPFLGWFFHYAPFVIMARVTYLHHYMPALYFAIFILGFLVDQLTCKKAYLLTALSLEVITIGFFWYFKPIAFGMDGEPRDFEYLRWFDTWHPGEG